MKSRLCVMILAAVLTAAFTGCSKKEKGAGPGEKQKANQVVEQLLKGFQTDTPASGLAGLFSDSLDAKVVSSYLDEKLKSEAVLQFVAGTPKEKKKGLAEVEYIYLYQNKKKDGTVDYNSKRNKFHGKAILESKAGEWKITRFDPELDKALEKSLFYSCARVVALTQLAEEQFFGDNGNYTVSFAMLGQALDFDRGGCAKIEVVEADKHGYLIKAATKNMPPCEIEADSDKMTPEKFSGCAASAPSAAPAEKVKPAAAKPAAKPAKAPEKAAE